MPQTSSGLVRSFVCNLKGQLRARKHCSLRPNGTTLQNKTPFQFNMILLITAVYLILKQRTLVTLRKKYQILERRHKYDTAAWS